MEIPRGAEAQRAPTTKQKGQRKDERRIRNGMFLFALFLGFRRACAYALNLSYPSSFRVFLVGTYTHACPAAASVLISTRPVPILKQRGGGDSRSDPHTSHQYHIIIALFGRLPTYSPLLYILISETHHYFLLLSALGP